MAYWLIKSEPSSYSIDHLKNDKKTFWNGVRNFQARNFMKDEMRVGDLVLFYHSNAEPPGIAGIASVCKQAYPDFTSWDPKDKHYDPRSTPTKPLWHMVDLKFVEKFSHFISLDQLRKNSALKDMLVLKKGMRLSIQPVKKEHFEMIRQWGMETV